MSKDDSPNPHHNTGKKHAQKSTEEKRGASVHIRCRPEHKAAWEAAAKAENRTFTGWLVDNLNRIVKK